MVAKYRKKPVVIEAIQWMGYNPTEARLFARDEDGEECFDCVKPAVYDFLHDTWIPCEEGDWIIRGVQGEFYPCKPDIFEATYESAEEDTRGS